MPKVVYRTEIYGEGDWHVAVCPDFRLSRTGDTPSDAAERAERAVLGYLYSCERDGILDSVLEESGFEKRDGAWRPSPRTVEEKTAVIENGAPDGCGDSEWRDYVVKTKDGLEIPVKRLTEDDLRRSLREFEVKYGMTSKEFVKRWSRGDLDCAVMDYFEWEFCCDSLARVYGEEDLRFEYPPEGSIEIE